MNVTPQYKVISSDNYDRIKHVLKKKILRDKIEVTVKLKDAFSLKITNCVISFKVIVSQH